MADSGERGPAANGKKGRHVMPPTVPCMFAPPNNVCSHTHCQAYYRRRTNTQVMAAKHDIEQAARRVMDLYGGNLDHPALDHLEAAIASIEAVHNGRSVPPAEEVDP